jgi:Fic family protein
MAERQNIEITNKAKLYRIVKSRMSAFELGNWQGAFAVAYTHDSTAIEGNTLTLLQTKIVLEDKITPGEVPVRDVMEVHAHHEAFQFILSEFAAGREIDEEFIKDVHMRVLPSPGIGGIYRTVPVYIRGAEHVPPNYLKVREEMKYFAADFN